jgi:predicted amidophosphoribosyltransferase
MQVKEIMVFETHYGPTGFFICPRCKSNMEGSFTAYCDRCGQRLNWKDYRRAKKLYPGGHR